jgi:hypothetical protein
LVGGLVFLRFINAAIVAPGAYEGLMFIDMSAVVCHCCCVFVFVIEIFALFSGVLPDTLEITPRAQRNLVIIIIIIIITNSLKHSNKP